MTGITLQPDGTVVVPAVTPSIDVYGGAVSGKQPVVTTVAASGASQTLTLPAAGDAAFDITLSAACAFTPTGGTAGKLGTITVILRQDTSGGRAPSFPYTVQWPGQIPPVFNAATSKYDVVQLSTVDGGATWIGALVASSVQAVTVPQAPVSLSGTPANGQVVLNWVPAGTGGAAITGYKVYRSTSSGAETLLTTLGNVLTFTDTGLTNGTTYWYRISAVNGVGEGPQSSEIGTTAGRYLAVTTGGASTPYTAGMVPGAGTIDLRVLVEMSSWVPAGNNFILDSWGATAANNRYALYIDNAGKLNGAWYNAAGVFQGTPSSVPTNIPAGGTAWVRALLNPTAGTCVYYTSYDGVTWTQLGTTVSGLTTTGVQTTGTPYALTIGQTGSAAGQFAGRVYKAQVLIAAAAQATVDYTVAAAAAATVTGAQAEIWTTISPAAVT